MECESKVLVECEKKRKSNILKPKQLCRDIFKIMLYKKIHAGIGKRREFVSEHMDIILYKDYKDLKRISENDEANCYLAGSDQIWNPLRCAPAFFLDFVKNKNLN